MTKIKKVIHYRDADNGKYISEEKAKKNPKQSVREVDKIKIKKKK